MAYLKIQMIEDDLNSRKVFKNSPIFGLEIRKDSGIAFERMINDIFELIGKS